MSLMVRKQIYIESQQEELLKKVAAETGMTEAEIFRQALSDWMTGEQHRRSAQTAWAQVLAFVEERAAQGFISGRRTWTRNELHEEQSGYDDQRPD